MRSRHRQCVECHEFKAVATFKLKTTGAYSDVCGTCRWEFMNLSPSQRRGLQVSRPPRPPLAVPRPVKQDAWQHRVGKAKATATTPTKRLYVGSTKGAKVPGSISAESMPKEYR